jgi:hypothetical protein
MMTMMTMMTRMTMRQKHFDQGRDKSGQAAPILCSRVLTTMTMMTTELFPVLSVQRTAWLLSRLKSEMVLACLDWRWMPSLLLLLLLALLVLLLPMMMWPAACCLWSAAC